MDRKRVWIAEGAPLSECPNCHGFGTIIGAIVPSGEAHHSEVDDAVVEDYQTYVGCPLCHGRGTIVKT